MSCRIEQRIPPLILVVDDEVESRAMLAWFLNGRGYTTVAAPDAQAALNTIAKYDFNVIVSDIRVPGMDGISFVRAVREVNANIPVIFLTDSPALETAREAIELGAFRCLVKPLNKAELEVTVARALAAQRLGNLTWEASELIAHEDERPAGLASLQVRFEKALSTLWIAYQPIVRTIDGSVFGYEALMQSGEPSLSSPAAILDAAERLDKLIELGRVVRSCATRPLEHGQEDLSLFVKLHPAELLDDQMLSPDAPMSAVAHRTFLEITERDAIDNVFDARDRVARLRRAGYRIAVEDLGAGYAGLTTFAALEPDIVKLDMALTRGSDRSPLKRRLIRAICGACDDLGILVVAEGVETSAERDTAAELGCDFIQGFCLARPVRGCLEVRAS